VNACLVASARQSVHTSDWACNACSRTLFAYRSSWCSCAPTRNGAHGAHPIIE
jgi:hypothetical protein